LYLYYHISDTFIIRFFTTSGLVSMILQMAAQNLQFLAYILFTSEANFSRKTITNFHNNHLWAKNNPHTIKKHYQHQFSLNGLELLERI